MNKLFSIIAGSNLAILLSLGMAKVGITQTGVGLLPDLQTVVPTHLQLVNQQQQEILRFSNGIANTGDGPWAMRPANNGGISTSIQEIRDANGNVVLEHTGTSFAFHEAHNHWHVGDVARFEIRAGSPIGPVVGNNSFKITFCLIDWYKLADNSPTSQRTFWDCDSPTSYQGVSAGWVDQYHHSTVGQQLYLTGLPDGLYYLVSTTNPDGKFLEKDYTNNTAWVAFRLYQGGNGNRKIEIVGNSPCDTPALCGAKSPNR